MDYFIVGDVHGCLHTFQALLGFWEKDTQMLIQAGDLIDRGRFGPEVVQLARKLQRDGENCRFLKGNHELDSVMYAAGPEFDNWLYNGGKQTIEDYRKGGFSLEEDQKWFLNLPTFFETDHVMVSHAGITDSKEAFDQFSLDGLLWTREPLKNLGKVQVHGHTAHRAGKPMYTEASNSWNVDTGAVFGRGLSAIILGESGDVTGTRFMETFAIDIGRKV